VCVCQGRGVAGRRECVRAARWLCVCVSRERDGWQEGVCEGSQVAVCVKGEGGWQRGGG
jgi:hypothetical protein